MSVLITGGAGFIGSHTARLLTESGFQVIVLDNLSSGRIENARWGEFVEGDIADTGLVRSVIQGHRVTTVLHLAGSTHVAESMTQPHAYLKNNVGATLQLLDAMIAEGVNQFVFASTCAVYGDPGSTPVREEESVAPLSPYGESKLQVERALPWYEKAYGLRWTALRYFNVAGASEDLSEDIPTSVRIIPRAIHSGMGRGQGLYVFGTTFPTPDGSAVRDYVHVRDVARANLQALQCVQQGHQGRVINIGSGVGISVLQIIDMVTRQLGKRIDFHAADARPGDPASVVSDIAKARTILQWEPEESELTQLVASVIRSCPSRPADALTPEAESLRGS